MRISVVIPVYNQGRYLEQSVKSVWAQEETDIEVIVVDDGSTDQTPTVVLSLADKGPLRWIRQSNGGPSAARNRGIKESRGEWIAFLDADDYWLPGKLKVQLQAMQEGGHDFSCCGDNVVNDDGTIVSSRPLRASRYSLNDLVWGNRIATPTVVVRRKLLEAVGLFDESLSMGEDWDLWLRLAILRPWQCITEPMACVRFGDWNVKGFEIKKYDITEFECALLTILSKLFESLPMAHEHNLMPKKRQVLSWHYSVLAKSHCRQGNYLRSLRYVRLCIASSPMGVAYLSPIRLIRPSS